MCKLNTHCDIKNAHVIKVPKEERQRSLHREDECLSSVGGVCLDRKNKKQKKKPEWAREKMYYRLGKMHLRKHIGTVLLIKRKLQVFNLSLIEGQPWEQKMRLESNF